MRAVLILILCVLFGPAWGQSPCGVGGPACQVEGGSYRIEWPQGDGPWPVLVFLHGAGSHGGAIMDNRVLVDTFLDGGMAVLAPDGYRREGRADTARGWSFIPGAPKRRNEHAFLTAVFADAADRFPLIRERFVLSGFSLGGSLAWYMACDHPQLAFAYAPIGGAFWRPHPEVGRCKEPVRLFHTHGWKDKVVPLEGRPLWDGQIVQGDVFHALDLMRQANGCTGFRPDGFAIVDRYWDRWWSDCTPTSALRFAIHPGAHIVPQGWSARTLTWLDGLDAWSLPPSQ